MSNTFTVAVPIMTNSVDVKKGEELFVENKSKKGTNRKEGPSWKDSVSKAEKAPKVLRGHPKTKIAAPSPEVITDI